MSTIIIADLHLKNNYKDFANFCQNIAINYENLFILGDLFDLYLGDDLIDKYYAEVSQILKKLSKSTKIFIMTGNKDFLIGEKFALASGVKLIKSPYILDNYILIHGDSLVRADKGYQLFKLLFQNSISKFILNSLPKKLREKLAEKIQQKAKIAKKNKPLQIMDVDNNFADKFMQKYNGKDLIHGHTHRPKVHNRNNYKRYVLASWDNNANAITIKNNNLEIISI